MKRLSNFVCVLISLFAVTAMAQGAFDSGPPPKQSFQQGGQAPMQQPPAPNTTDPNVVKRTVTPNTTNVPGLNTPKQATPTPGTTAPAPLVSGNDVPAMQLLQQQVTQWQSKTDEQITALMQTNQQLQVQMQKFNDALMSLNQEVTQLRSNMKAAQSSNPWLQKLQQADNSLTTEMKLAIVAALFVLAMLLGYLLSGRKKVVVSKPVPLTPNTMATKKTMAPEPKVTPTKVTAPKAKVTAPADDDTENEYDFMGTTEAIPAKLDLARAYVAMEDYTAAKNALQEVIAEGNAQQKKEAQEISASIPS